ncbi:MAG: cytochrome c biogenesis CcdA family protein [Actinomycetota bacterium]
MDTATLLLAVAAGAGAAFNPCGFALLPAYLTMLVAGPGTASHPFPKEGVSGTSQIHRALRFTSGMTAGFILVFGGFAILIAPVAGSVQRWLPVVTLILGVGLIGLGIAMLAGRKLPVPQFRRGRAPSTSWTSQVGYGVTFALASLSCTIGPFLAVTAGAIRERDPLGVVWSFLAYALGMGAVVGVLAIAVAGARGTVIRHMRNAVGWLNRVGGALVLVAGAYITWYGWFELRVFAGTATSDPIVDTALRAQTWLSRTVDGFGTTWVFIAIPVLVITAISMWAYRRQATHRNTGPPLA